MYMYYAERKCYKVLCVLVRSLVTVLLKKLELVGMLEYSHAFVGLKVFTSVDTAQVFDKELYTCTCTCIYGYSIQI